MMRISYNWLKVFLPTLTQEPRELAEVLTAHSFETSVTDHIDIDQHIKVVRIVKLQAHPHAQRLQLATITDGQDTVRIVCGARNIHENDCVPYAPPGSSVFDKDGRKSTVREVVIRGEKSPGMLNSPRELGLGSWHGGIMLLPPDTPLGSLLGKHLPADSILEADVTPNRAHDCLSQRGIAREVAAVLDIPMNEQELPALPPSHKEIEGWSVTIEDDHLTPRYLGALLKNVNIGPSPLWMQARLYAAGAKPINNIVDSTNYVMLEMGNPLHAFDADKLPGKKMSVRRAKTGETITTLDGKLHQLSGGELIIASNETLVAIAGVIGGKASEVSATTTTLFLEVANFNAYAIQQTTAQHATITEASNRFRKGIDPNLVTDAAARTIHLLKDSAGAQLVGLLDHYSRPRKPRAIPLVPSTIEQLAGTRIAEGKTHDILQRLRCRIDKKQGEWSVTPPSDRLDLTTAPDLAEEIVRVTGFENIPSNLPAMHAKPKPLPPAVRWRETIRDALADFGMTEVYNPVFEDDAGAALLNITEPPLEITNPVSPKLHYLRRSLIPNLLCTVLKNKGLARIQYVFEIGRVFKKEENTPTNLPRVRETQKVAGIVAGNIGAYKIVQDIVTALLEQCGITDAYIKRGGDITHDSATFGSVGELKSTTASGVKAMQPLAFFELNLDVVLENIDEEPRYYYTATGEPQQFEPFSKYPPLLRDISVLADARVSSDEIQEIIERVGGKLVADVDLFDLFHPENEERKSVAFHIRYQAPDRTLTDEEVNRVHQRVEDAIQKELGAHVR